MRQAQRGGFNWPLLLAVLAVFGLGLLNLQSAARTANRDLAFIQSLWFGFSLLAALVLSLLHYHVLERLAYPAWVVGLVLLLMVLAFGKVINNSRSWIGLGLFNFQPSEVVKIALVVALAKYFADDADLQRKPSFVAKLISALQPVYPVGMIVAILWFWNHPTLLRSGAGGIFRYGTLAAALIWEALILVPRFLRRRLPGEDGVLGQTQVKRYTLDDLIKPESPAYPLGGLLALIVFWEKEGVASLENLRFLLLALCTIWAGISILFAFSAGRTKVHDWLSPVILMALPGILILAQPDFGTAMVTEVTAASILLFMRVRWSSLVIAGLVLAVTGLLAFAFVLKPYQQDRIMNFLEPSTNTQDSGYHARQSMIAIGSGRLTGKGHAQSTQTQFQFLPEQHTDFVFSVWAEEQGFLGCLGVLGLFLFLLALLINVASSARDLFGILIAVSMAFLCFWHIFINVGMVTGVMPVVGLTLPLWSYGGSSVFAFMLGFGLVFSVSRHSTG